MSGLSSDEIGLFVQVVERGSFAAAAADSGLTPSALSKAMTRLEDRLGVRLLERTTRRLALTAEGELLLTRGRDILAAVEAAEADVTAARGKPRGRLRVSVGSAFAKHRLTRLIAEFHDRFPDVKLELSITDRRVDVIAEQIDVAIRTGPLTDSSLVTRRIGESRRIICASPAYLARRGTPATPADLQQHDCLVVIGLATLAEWPMRVDDTVKRVVVQGAIASDSADLVLDLAIAGLGIIRLADFVLEEALTSGRLVPLLTEHHADEPVPVSVLMPPGRQALPRVRAFVDFIAGHCAATVNDPTR